MLAWLSVGSVTRETGRLVEVTRLASGAVAVSGWLSAARHRGAVAALRVDIDGLNVLRIPLDELGIAQFETEPERLQWQIEVAGRACRAGSWLEVLAELRNRVVTLGVGIVPAGQAMTGTTVEIVNARRVVGAIDLPRPGSTAQTRAIQVVGWTLIDDAPADRVEVFIDDQPAQLLRRAVPRTDLAPHPCRFTAGFDTVITLPDRAPGSELMLRVRGVGVDGTVWAPPAVPVRYAPRTGLRSIPAQLAFDPSRSSANTGQEQTRLRVAVLTHSLSIGGGQLYLQELLLRLASRHAFELLVVSPEDGILRQELEAAGIAVHVRPGYPVDPRFYHAGVAELAALLDRWQARAVIANTFGVFPGVDAALAAGLPIVWAIHESFDPPVFEYLNWGPAGLHPMVSERMTQTLSCADLVVFEAQPTLELYQRAAPNMRARVIPYGVDEGSIGEFLTSYDRDRIRAERGILADEIAFVCVGVFEPRKAILALVAAFAQVAAGPGNARLFLVGAHPAPYSAAVAEYVATLPCADRITIVEINPDIYPWYLAADFIVSASDVESLPRSLIEAMHFGVPIIAADAFGTAELIEDGGTGFLCAPNSHTALVAALSRALRLSVDERCAFRRRSRERARTMRGRHYDDDYATRITALVNNSRLPEVEH